MSNKTAQERLDELAEIYNRRSKADNNISAVMGWLTEVTIWLVKAEVNRLNEQCAKENRK